MCRMGFLRRGLVAAVLCCSSGASAQGSVARTAPPSGVTFGRIDQATVRVFAVQNVSQENVRGRYRTRVLGIPEGGHGTGVVVDPRGVIVTAKHVIEGARQLAVRLPGSGEVLPARVAYADGELDFAILLVHLGDETLEPIELPAQPVPLAVRQTVDAVGYPFDPEREQPQSARGIISGVLPDGHLQLDMSLNPGNSGGPLLDQSENLVGIVVARGDPERGAQGIGIAVPIAPVRAAYDHVRRSGLLSRTYRELHGSLEASRQTAEAVDAIVRFGGGDVLREAADFVDNPEASERIDQLRAMADRARDPDVLALLAAYFWDAAQVMVERAGGVATPAQMPPGPAQQLADDLWRRALALATRARDADPTVLQRSPFVGYLAGPGNTRPAATASSTTGGWRPPPESERPPNWRGGSESENQKWFPWLSAGIAFFGAGGSSSTWGFGGSLSVLLPLGSGGTRTGFRIRPLLGIQGDFGAWTSDAAYFVGGALGLALRFGGRVGMHFKALWTPGYHQSSYCVDDSYDDYYCVRAEGATWTSFQFGVGARFGTFHLGTAFRFFEPADSGTFQWVITFPELGWTF